MLKNLLGESDMMKIYIMPCGWDKEMVVKTAFKSGADKICLVSACQKKKHTYSNADKITKSVNEHLIKQLSKLTEVDTIDVNYIDLKDIIIQINKYIKSHNGDDIIINISTGSHLLAAVLFFVAQMNHIKIEYSIAKNHNPKIMEIIGRGGDLHKGLSEVIQIPSLPFSVKFNSKELKMLNKLKEKKEISVSDFVENSNGNDENRLRSEFHYLCRKLEKQGFVKIINNGKKFSVRLTDFGEIFVF